MRLGGGPGVDRDVAPGLDDAIEGRAIHDKVLDDREALRTPRLKGDRVAVRKRAHVQLARRGPLGPVRVAVDDDAALAADSLAAVRIESERLLAFVEKLFVEDVEHLQERGVLVHVVKRVRLEVARIGRAVLTPVLQVDSHL